MKTADVSSRMLRFCSDVSQMKRNYENFKVKPSPDGIPKRNLEQFRNFPSGGGAYMPPEQYRVKKKGQIELRLKCL